MERERREVCDRPDGFIAYPRAERVGGICHYSHPAYRFLYVGTRAEEIFLSFDDVVQAFVIAGYAAEIDGDYRLSLFGYRVFDSVVIGRKAVFASIDEYEFRPDVADDRCACRIGIRRGYNLVAIGNAEYAQSEFGARRLRVEAYSLIRAAKIRDFAFQLFGFRSRGYPARPESVRNFVYLLLGYIRRGKFNYHNDSPHL